MKKILTIAIVLMAVAVSIQAQKRIMFDLSHSQCTDVYEGHETYPLVVPAYTEMAQQLGAELVVNNDAEITPQLLKKIDVLVMLSPLSNKLQKDLTEVEKQALVNYVNKGGSLIFFVDDNHRVDLDRYGANDVTRPFGIEFGKDVPLPGNVGAVSFKSEIFKERYEIPYSGACVMTGGTPVSVCMEDGWLHGTYVKTKKGGKLFVGGDTMVGLLLGYPDGVRKVTNRMETRWWGKDSRAYITDLLAWALKK
ncbi:MAG: hypothetical protein J6U14_03340 [Bacteroidaceae bacterium]|nr:hypothetical protein [Bacteroidaceae bacterium]